MSMRKSFGKEDMQLSHGEKHLLRLIQKGTDADGWAKVSKHVWPLVEKLPTQLCELRATEDGGFIKLTHDGKTVLDWS